MTLTRFVTEGLDAVAGLGRPDSASLVTTGGDDFVALWVERDFTDFVFMTLKDACASSSEDVINSRHSVCASSS